MIAGPAQGTLNVCVIGIRGAISRIVSLRAAKLHLPGRSDALEAHSTGPDLGHAGDTLSTTAQKRLHYYLFDRRSFGFV